MTSHKTAPRDGRYGSAVKSTTALPEDARSAPTLMSRGSQPPASPQFWGRGSTLSHLGTHLQSHVQIYTQTHQYTQLNINKQKQDLGMRFGKKRQWGERAMQDALSNEVLRAQALIETLTQFQVYRTERTGAGVPSLEEPQRTLRA